MSKQTRPSSFTLPDPINISIISPPKKGFRIGDNLKFILGLLVVVVGWYIVSYLNSRNNTQNKLLELKTQYAINSYHQIARSLRLAHRGHPPLEVEEALSNVLLFGSEKQIALADSLMKEMAKGGIANPQPLLRSLREDFRKMVGLDPVTGEIVNFIVDTVSKQSGYYIVCPKTRRNAFTGFKLDRYYDEKTEYSFTCPKCGETHKFDINKAMAYDPN